MSMAAGSRNLASIGCSKPVPEYAWHHAASERCIEDRPSRAYILAFDNNGITETGKQLPPFTMGSEKGMVLVTVE